MLIGGFIQELVKPPCSRLLRDEFLEKQSNNGSRLRVVGQKLRLDEFVLLVLRKLDP